MAITLFTGLGAAILGAWRHSEHFRESVRGILAALRGAFAPVVAELRSLREALGNLFQPLQGTRQAALGGVQVGVDRILYTLGYGLGFLFGLLRTLLERLAPILGEGLGGVVRLIRGLVETAVGLLTGDWARAVNGARLVWESLKAVLSVPIRVGGLVLDLFSRGLSALWSAVSSRFPAIRSIVGAPLRVGALLWDRAREGFATLLAAAQAFWAALSTAFRAGIATLRALLQGDLGKALEFGRTAMTALRGVLSIPLRLAGVAWDALKGGLESALGWVRGLVERMVQAGRDLVAGLVRGIGDMAMAPVRAIQGIGAQIWQGLKAKLGIRSPSRVMAQLGAMTALGLAVGIQNMAPAVARSAERLAQLSLPQVEGVLAMPPAPSLKPLDLEAPSTLPSAKGAQPTQNIRIHIERLELPSVREPEEFIEALKRLVLSYAQ